MKAKPVLRSVSVIILVCLLFTSLTACKDSDETKYSEELYQELMATPPTVYETKKPFSLGELIPPTKDSLIWKIGYGNFPAIMCSNLFADLGNGFARAFLDFPGRDKEESFVADVEKSYALASFLDPRIYGFPMYDPEQRVEFDGSAGLNLLLLTEYNQEDRTYLENGTGEKVTAVEIARSAVVFVVHGDNPVDGLTFGQLKDVLTGRITNWSELGWDSRPIGLYYESNAELKAVLDLRVLGGEGLCDPVMETETMGGLDVLVRAPYENQPEAIYITVLREGKEMAGNKILAIDETTPVADAILNNKYPVTFGCFAVHRTSDENGTPGRFVEWIFSQDGAQLIETIGFVPVPYAD